MPDRCRLCGSALEGSALAVLHDAPAGAQRLPDAASLPSDRGITLEIRECGTCGLVQRTGTPVAYHRDVITAAGLSPAMLEQRRRLVGEWVRRRGLAGASVLEVGAGRGEMLPVLAAEGLRPVGLEHSVPAEGASRDGFRIEHGFPGEGASVPGAPFDAFVCFDFLEHAPDPVTFLQAVAALLRPGAPGLVEVPALEHDIEERCGYDWIADHLSYFEEPTLRLALESAGFEVGGVERTWQGYDLVADIVLSGQAAPGSPPAPRRGASGAARLAGDLREAVDAIDAWLEAQEAAGRRVAVWGASHQALTLLSQSARRSAVAFIVDSAPFKQGRYAPATHIPILAPDELERRGADAVLVMAAGYSDEVVRLLAAGGFGGTVCVLRGNEVVSG